jgi:TorA maturation chaperone TorD
MDASHDAAPDRGPARGPVLYHLLGGLLLECPKAETLEGFARHRVLELLASQSEDEGLRAGLELMHDALADTSIEAIQNDYARLFLGLGTCKAPPFESAYRSEERLVWQEAAREVLVDYANARLGYEQMDRLPPDHIGRELLFMASLAEGAPARDRERAFVEKHLSWVPAFARDIEAGASTRFFVGLARALGGHLREERRRLALEVS